MRPPRFVLVVLALAAAAAGCTTATIVVPADLATGVTPFAVTGLNPRTTNKPIGFGGYTATVREGWQKSQSVTVLGISVGKALRPYRFELSGGGATASAACAAAAAEVWRGSVSAELPVEAVLACSIALAGATHELALDPAGKGALAGTVGGPRHTLDFEIRSLHRLAGAAWSVSEPVGYELRRDGATVAAAETVNAGRVWLAPSLAPADRDLAAAVLTALLFFTPAQVQ